MEKVRLGDVCSKDSSNIAQKDLDNNDGTFPIYGASGFIKNVDFYKQEKEYIAVVKDGAGVGRVMKCPAKSSVIGTMQYILPKENIKANRITEKSKMLINMNFVYSHDYGEPLETITKYAKQLYEDLMKIQNEDTNDLNVKDFVTLLTANTCDIRKSILYLQFWIRSGGGFLEERPLSLCRKLLC